MDTEANPSDLRDFLAYMVLYVLENDVVLQDGETIGFFANDKHIITRSPGVVLSDQMTLKISYAAFAYGEENNMISNFVMDDGIYHQESVVKKGLSVDATAVYHHMAIYLRWCMEHDLMHEDFLKEYGDMVKQVNANPSAVNLCTFIQNELQGQLWSGCFDEQGQAFAHYYYGKNNYPYYPSDIDNYALDIIGQEKNDSDEIQDEAYLFVPYDEQYYQAMAQVIEKRFRNWQSQSFDEDTLEPSDLAQAFMDYLDCECEYFPSMKNDDPITAAYSYAKRKGVQEGYIPVLVKVDDILWECIIMNTHTDGFRTMDFLSFDREQVARYRKEMLEHSLEDGKVILDGMTENLKEYAEEDDMTLEDMMGNMEGGYPNNHFCCYWEFRADLTAPLILAKISVKHPWEIFAYLPFGNWNECPNTLALMAVAKYWLEQYGAIPAAITHDELEFVLPLPIAKEKAMDVAIAQYGFCMDMEQNMDSIGALADVLWQSNHWYFWWD